MRPVQPSPSQENPQKQIQFAVRATTMLRGSKKKQGTRNKSTHDRAQEEREGGNAVRLTFETEWAAVGARENR